MLWIAQGVASGEAKNNPAPHFSLSDRYAPAAVLAMSDPADSQESSSQTPPAPEHFTFKSITGDFLKDAGEIWTYPLHIRTHDLLPIASVAAPRRVRSISSLASTRICAGGSARISPVPGTTVTMPKRRAALTAATATTGRCAPSLIHCLITDEGILDKDRLAFQKAGIEVIVA